MSVLEVSSKRIVVGRQGTWTHRMIGGVTGHRPRCFGAGHSLRGSLAACASSTAEVGFPGEHRGLHVRQKRHTDYNCDSLSGAPL